MGWPVSWYFFIAVAPFCLKARFRAILGLYRRRQAARSRRPVCPPRRYTAPPGPGWTCGPRRGSTLFGTLPTLGPVRLSARAPGHPGCAAACIRTVPAPAASPGGAARSGSSCVRPLCLGYFFEKEHPFLYREKIATE